MGFEEEIQKSIFSRDTEKTYIDKLLARREIDRVKELIKKDKLNRSELLELLYMCLGAEAKLINLGEWDRYILLKFFVWIREFIKVAELMYDTKEYLEEKERKGIYTTTERTKQILLNNERLIEHNAKFLIDLYFNISRTTLSLGGTAFLELLKNKFELSYPQAGMAADNKEQKKLMMKAQSGR